MQRIAKYFPLTADSDLELMDLANRLIGAGLQPFGAVTAIPSEPSGKLLQIFVAYTDGDVVLPADSIAALDKTAQQIVGEVRETGRIVRKLINQP